MIEIIHLLLQETQQQVARQPVPSSCAVAPSFLRPFFSFPFPCGVFRLYFDSLPYVGSQVEELRRPCAHSPIIHVRVERGVFSVTAEIVRNSSSV